MCPLKNYGDPFITTDPSTHEDNYVSLALDLEEAAVQGTPAEGALVLIEMLDHDLVRRIFMGFGGPSTDSLLNGLAGRLRSIIAPNFSLYYVGVGRFVILTDLDDDALSCFLYAVVDAFQQPFDSGNIQVKFEIAIGVLDMAIAVGNPADALRKATVAANECRSHSRVCTVYSAETDAAKIRLYRALLEVAQAISERQFRLVFQPKVDAHGALSGVEALLRWTHPVYGNIAPGEFIPLADDTEIMVDITHWVLREALDALVVLKNSGRHVPMSINVSSRSLKDTQFSTTVALELSRRDISPELLIIECTEYSAFRSSQCVATLHRLKTVGVRIALDDFGSGYSNLASLQNIPIDHIKIDKSLIDGAPDNGHCASILVSVIQMCKKLGYRLTAEGIESASVLESLRQLDIDEFQGYFISMPVGLDAVCRLPHRLVELE